MNKALTVLIICVESDDRALRLAQEANEDYVDTEAYRKDQSTGSATERGQASQTGDGAYPQSNRTGDVPSEPIVGGPPKDREQGHSSATAAHEDVDDAEGDLSQIPREDGPKTGKEEKEEAMKKAQTAGQKSNKVEYKG